MHEKHPDSESNVGHDQGRGDTELHHHDEPQDPSKPHDHGHEEICYCDSFITINGHTIDLAREPLNIEFRGFTLKVSYSASKERGFGERHTEKYRDYEIVITGAEKGEPRLGRPPGRLFINGKHIDFNYDPATGRIYHHGIFSVHYSLTDFARAYINANPNLLDIGHHHAKE